MMLFCYSIMAKLRICITIDKELVKKIRTIQGKEIQKSKKSISFSQVLEDIVNQGLKN